MRLFLVIFVAVLLLSDVSCAKKRKRPKKPVTTPPPTTSSAFTTSTSQPETTSTTEPQTTTESGVTTQAVTTAPAVTTRPTTLPSATSRDSIVTIATDTTSSDWETYTAPATDLESTSGPGNLEIEGETTSSSGEDATTTTPFITDGSSSGSMTSSSGSSLASTSSSADTTMMQTTVHLDTSLYISTPIPTEPAINICPSYKYTCKHRHKCVGWGHVCNGKVDCPGGDDEKDCPTTEAPEEDSEGYGETQAPECLEGEVSCKRNYANVCLPRFMKCDGQHDCDDGLDEVNCTKLTCSHDHWLCTDGRRCVAKSEWCNGIKNCKDNSDEDNCPEPCPKGQWKCKTGDCIADVYRCDGYSGDCWDYSDETNCDIRN